MRSAQVDEQCCQSDVLRSSVEREQGDELCEALRSSTSDRYYSIGAPPSVLTAALMDCGRRAMCPDAASAAVR